jgi:hypothetical protein
MEVADQRRGAAGVHHPLLDLGHRRRGFGPVDGHTHHLRTGPGQLNALLRGRSSVGSVGQCHRLHDDWRPAADLDRADSDADCPVKLHLRHGCFMVQQS